MRCCSYAGERLGMQRRSQTMEPCYLRDDLPGLDEGVHSGLKRLRREDELVLSLA